MNKSMTIKKNLLFVTGRHFDESHDKMHDGIQRYEVFFKILIHQFRSEMINPVNFMVYSIFFL